VGLHFKNLQIPQGSTVLDARVQFECDFPRDDLPNDLEIWCEDEDDALEFVEVDDNISDRPLTSASTLWSPPEWTTAQQRSPIERTPSFSGAADEVINRGGWAEGNNLVTIIENESGGDVGRHEAEALHGVAGTGPELQIKWRSPGVEAETGVSLFTYTGIGIARDLMHGNPNIPDLIALKNLGGNDWVVYINTIATAGAPEDGRLSFNNTGAYVASADWDNTAPGGTFFRVGTPDRVNELDVDFAGFAFSNLRGFLKVFRYVGNNSLNGPEVYLGFKPRFLAIKRTDAAGNWVTMYKCTDIIGAQNNQFNLMDSMGFLNTTANFFQNIGIEAYSNGFKIRDTDTDANANAVEYVGWAIAEAAFPIAKAPN
jgi:hypothetical protein